jgi:hypothetical protein
LEGIFAVVVQVGVGGGVVFWAGRLENGPGFLGWDDGFLR